MHMARPWTERRLLTWVSRIVAVLLPLFALFILVVSNVQDWRHANGLAEVIVREESADHAHRLAQGLGNLLQERANDLALLAMIWRAPQPEQRADLFLREASALTARESLYVMINYVDDTGVVRLSAPAEQSNAIVGRNVREKPDRDAWHAQVLRTGEPLCSEPVTSSSGEPRLLIWTPVYEGPGTKQTPIGLLAAVIDLDALLQRVLSIPSATDYEIQVSCDNHTVIRPPQTDVDPAAVASGLAGSAYIETLGRTWRIRTFPDASTVYARLLGQNTRRLFIDLMVSALVFALLVIIVAAMARLRRHRRALRANEERLQLAMEAARDAVWEWHIPSDTYVCDQCYKALGFTPEQIVPTRAFWQSLIHAEDRDRVSRTLREHLDGETAFYECEYRLVAGDAPPMWVLDRGKVVARDRSGAPLRMMGTHRDITQLKNAEEARRKSDELYRLIAENSTDLITRHLPDGTYLYVSPAIRRLAGFEPEELLGHTVYEYLHPDDIEGLRQSSFRALAGAQNVVAAFRRRRKNGSYYWAETVGTVLRDPNTGEVNDIICVTRDVTARVEAEQALRQSEARLDLAIRGAGLGTWEWDANTDTVTFGKGWAELLGYSLEELAGSGEAFRSLVHPDDLPQLMRAYDEYVAGRAAFYESEHRLRMKDGTWKWVLDRGRALQRDDDGRPIRVSGVIQDISKRKKAEAAFRRESARAQRYLDIAGVMLVALDAGGEITMINKKGCEILGYTEEELLGRNWFEMCIPEKKRHAMRQVLAGILQGDVAVYEYVENPVLTKSGEERLIAWHNTALHGDEGVPVGILSSGEDITDRRRAEQAARERELQLIQADKLASLGVLVSGVAHEINNPNAFVMNNMELVEMAWAGALPILDRFWNEHGDFRLAGMDYSRIRERIPMLLAGIRDGARRIKLIVEELRGFARHEPDGIIESVNLNHVVNSATTLLANMLKKSTDHFEFDPCDDLPPVRGSFRRLEQVAVNLLQNACQALTDRSRHIHVSTRYDPFADAVSLVVEDGGAGMSPEVLPRITDPFFTTKRDAGGTGLGLSISATIIRQHGGDLHFASEPGAGTVATVTLPASKNMSGDRD